MPAPPGAGKLERDVETMTISDDVRFYLKHRPYVTELLSQGVFNYSSLARSVSQELGLGKAKTSAIKAALIREADRQKNSQLDAGRKISTVLSSSRIEVRSKVCVFLGFRTPPEGISTIAHSNSYGFQMSVLDQQDAAKIRLRAGERLEKGLDLVIIRSPQSIERTPGVISLVLSSLSREGINVSEFISCAYDTLLVVKNRDTERTFNILSNLMS